MVNQEGQSISSNLINVVSDVHYTKPPSPLCQTTVSIPTNLLKVIPHLEPIQDAMITSQDDVCLYDYNIESAFYHCFDFILLSAQAGITQNPNKFVCWIPSKMGLIPTQ